MKRSTIHSAPFALAAVAALAAVGAAAWSTPDQQQVTLEPAGVIERPAAIETAPDAAPVNPPQPAPASDDTAREVAEPYEGPGTVDEPTYACLPIEGRRVCDTFGESDEGPGTS